MHRERVFGIVGGTGPESTIDYYRSLGATWRRRRPDGTHPRVIVDSVDGGTVIRLLGEGEYEAVGRVFGAAIEALAAAGCGAALIASNLGHMAFDAARTTTGDPVHPHRRRGARRGGRGRPSARRDHRHAVRRRVAAVPGSVRARPASAIVQPTTTEEDTVHEIYYGELLDGVIRDDSAGGSWTSSRPCEPATGSTRCSSAAPSWR